MIQWLDTNPNVAVPFNEYKRLLGYPADAELSDRALQLCQSATQWYAEHGRPWIYARPVTELSLHEQTVSLERVPLSAKRLQEMLVAAQAHAAVLVAVGAGAELENAAEEFWRQEKPDEYYFLEVFGSAVVEHLIRTAGAQLCAWAEQRQMAMLPHYSPGYTEWDVADQGKLAEMLRRDSHGFFEERVEVLQSGMLRPKKSLLAVFGVTRHLQGVARLPELVPCTGCAYTPCQFRRAAYRPPNVSQPWQKQTEAAPAPRASQLNTSLPLEPQPHYTINRKALSRWADERLSWKTHKDGRLEFVFRFEGSTCSNMGRALAFDYRLTLSSREKGYRVLAQESHPAEQDEGHAFMCGVLNTSGALLSTIRQEQSMVGKPLKEVFRWQRPASAPACLCEAASRDHKWGLVLETVHYALANQALVHSPIYSTNQTASLSHETTP